MCIRDSFKKGILATKRAGKRKILFDNLGIWPTTTILSFFSPQEIIEMSRINKEAHFISKKVYAARKVGLERINMRSVKFFQRTDKIKITKDSLSFFLQFKDSFLNEILNAYKNVTTVTINLNWLFDERQKDYLFEKLAHFELRPNTTTLVIKQA